MKRPQRGRALFLHRDSGGKHEKAPAEYVRWACGQAAELGLKFDGTGEAIEGMIRDRQSQRGDLFLDYEVSGNQLSRPGLDRLIAEAKADRSVTHIFIPRRDRLARPDNPLDALVLEFSFRQDGITLVYMDRVCLPVAKGQRFDLADLIMGVVDFEHAGKDRRDLAQKILLAQLSLAKAGRSIGGSPPFGFRRWLVKHDGTRVRQLAPGERVRMAGHSVVWLPEPPDHPEVQLVFRILELLEKMPASRVAATLTAEGILSPGAGRTRTDQGVVHTVSGDWHSTTIINIARNPLLRAIVESGRRSMGDQLRFTAEGPRGLADGDYRPDGKPKVIRNDDANVIRSSAGFEPLIGAERDQRLTAILDVRAGSQRGKARSQDPSKNPLGSRIFDMGCHWPMYRNPYNGSFRYVCGLYQQSHGQKCAHNHVDGPTTTRFALTCLRQQVLKPGLQAKLRQRLRRLADQESGCASTVNDVATKDAAVRDLDDQLEKVGENMALAATPEQFQAVAGVFQKLSRQKVAIEAEIRATNARTSSRSSAESEIDTAMAVLERLPELASDNSNLAAIGEVFRMTNVRMFLDFRPVQVQKRVLNKLARGVITFGSATPPIPLYEGPTARRAVKGELTATVAVGPEGDFPLPYRGFSGREGKSLGNVNRGDRI